MPLQIQDMMGFPSDDFNPINFGRARIGRDTTQGFLIYNDDDRKAKNVCISAEACGDDPLPAAWKTFSMTEDGEYVPKLKIKDIPPHSYAEGSLYIEGIFNTAKDTLFIETWNTGITQYRGNILTLAKGTNDGAGIAARRMELATGNIRDVDLTFKIDYTMDDKYENTSMQTHNFPVRMNANKDRKGYIFSFQVNRYDSTVYVAIYKGGVGMSSNDNRDNGTRVYDSQKFLPFTEDTVFRLVITNNTKDQPTFQVFMDDAAIMLRNIRSGVKAEAMTDTGADAYVGKGRCYYDCALWNGDITASISDVELVTEEDVHVFYAKTSLPGGLPDGQIYESSLVVDYYYDAPEVR